MLLGISSALSHSSPEEWAKKQADLGVKSVVFPVNADAPEELIDRYVREAKAHNLTIAEVGVWRNTLSGDMEERKKAQDYAIRQLELADRIGANCCVNISGTPHGPLWDGGYRGNYSKETWKDTIESVQHIIDAVNPKNTVYAIEPMPWMVPSSPDEYLRMIEEVDRDGFGVHMDMVNMINCPQRYFFADEFIEECFEKLGSRICSCHLKDIRLLDDLTFQLREVGCGEGSFPIEKYVIAAEMARGDMPMIIEHLNTDEEYYESFRYVTARLQKAGISI